MPKHQERNGRLPEWHAISSRDEEDTQRLLYYSRKNLKKPEVTGTITTQREALQTFLADQRSILLAASIARG